MKELIKKIKQLFSSARINIAMIPAGAILWLISRLGDASIRPLDLLPPPYWLS